VIDVAGAFGVAKKSNHGGRRPGAGRPAKSERDDVAVKLDRAIVAKCRYVAEVRGITLAEYLTEALKPVAERDFAKVTKENGG
jgi:hypothetical protein